MFSHLRLTDFLRGPPAGPCTMPESLVLNLFALLDIESKLQNETFITLKIEVVLVSSANPN